MRDVDKNKKEKKQTKPKSDKQIKKSGGNEDFDIAKIRADVDRKLKGTKVQGSGLRDTNRHISRETFALFDR